MGNLPATAHFDPYAEMTRFEEKRGQTLALLDDLPDGAGERSLVPILWETGVGSDVMKPIAAPIVGGMITSTINVLILVPVFFVMMKARALRQGKLQTPEEADA